MPLNGEDTVLCCSFQQLSCLRPLKGFLSWLVALQRPSTSSHSLLPELQSYIDTVRYAELGAKVPGNHQEQAEQLTQTLIMCLYKTLFYTYP